MIAAAAFAFAELDVEIRVGSNAPQSDNPISFLSAEAQGGLPFDTHIRRLFNSVGGAAFSAARTFGSRLSSNLRQLASMMKLTIIILIPR